MVKYDLPQTDIQGIIATIPRNTAQAGLLLSRPDAKLSSRLKNTYWRTRSHVIPRLQAAGYTVSEQKHLLVVSK